MEILTEKIRINPKKAVFYFISGFVNKGLGIFNYIALPMIIVIFWISATKNELFPPVILPSIAMVFTSLISQISSGQIFQDVLISLSRVMQGYGIGLILGVFMGTLMGISGSTNKFFSGTFDAIRQIPPLAWIPLVILWFGVGETSKVILIAKASFFPILLNTISGIKSTPKAYIEVAKLYNKNSWKIFRQIYLPYALPNIFVGLRLGLSSAWMTVIAAELIASTSGIGYRINDARNLLQSDVVITGIIVVGLLGVIMDRILDRILRELTPWNTTK
ncbi:ABC transporter permease [Sebaldella termitidis]|uniref:ABC transporter permease n=1 Tax=Sebaldella termitidis TaxID=826 RepID=UPI003EBD25AE